jgi:UDP:flavonoid glycosyltransferase YjiC (YdhE family)
VFCVSFQLVVPILNDGPANAKEAERLGFGASLHWRDITEEALLEKIQQVLEDPTYQQNAEKWGDLLLDQV